MKPRIGFLGVGWIGRHRLEALAESDVAEIVAVSDSNPEAALAAAERVSVPIARTFEELLDHELDGLVIATPSALHARQAVDALQRGIAVFCQKPLARTAAETRRVVDQARAADRLLAVDLSYRWVEGVRRIRELIDRGELGRIYAVDLVFHNAYGPDKPWFYDPLLSGGGCVIDLGIHLVDLALWTLEPARVRDVSSYLFAKGEPLGERAGVVEDFAVAALELDQGAIVRLACSWNLPAGCDAVIQASFFGTEGGAMLSNVNGSFYDFAADRFRGTNRERLCGPPDQWGGRAIVDWATRLRLGGGFDENAEQLVDVAAAIDAIYGRRAPVTDTLNDRGPILARAGS
ncbi:MAG TPA: Gfo/Idh/MocA family oxidoreductase [Gemmatimonadales bacterium]|nr:Gfo/Idh/MocA family oxidoreductase [Gemmatimonadales bacterium]